MTFRERLADIISGGAVTAERNARVKADLALCNSRALLDKATRDRSAFQWALFGIEKATAAGKSGTAMKINRMARKGLK